ncbi:hypothetical protein [Rubinisphaera sp. JC750]|uniref:hypothetical protein n=1 Tax=Rubinisphaera sp. JC750 TaxID=2898658 RepID=UPI001F475147|nr:hypothetical protein [Rubinisphaera sp. JC750]
MSSDVLTCDYCGYTFSDSRTVCPHCAQPQLFPNVSKATSEKEKDKLNSAFETKRQQCVDDDRGDEFSQFYNAVASSHALFACSLQKLHREVASGTEVFETYYQIAELRVQVTAPAQLDWDKLRPQAEIELLGTHQNIDKLHYACLSLDWGSLTGYGDCVVKLKENMIRHRASCFQGNSAVIYFLESTFDDCLRSCWDDRGKIAAAVFANRLTPGVPDTKFSSLLVAPGKESVDDEFIEVHVFGPMTLRTFAAVNFTANDAGKRKAIYRDAIIEKLDAAGVTHNGTG